MTVYTTGTRVRAAASFARPANTTAYAASDVVSNNATTTTPMKFADVANQVGGSGIIRSAMLQTDQASATAELKLWLYSKSNFTVAGDNAAHALEWDDRADFLGVIDWGALATSGTGSEWAFALVHPDLEFVCAAGQIDIWGVLTIDGAHTPASGQSFRVELIIEH